MNTEQLVGQRHRGCRAPAQLLAGYRRLAENAKPDGLLRSELLSRR